jgi:hypothetical protein
MSIYEIPPTDDRSGVEDAGPAELPHLHGADHVLVVPDYIDEDGDQADVGSPGSPGTPGTPGMGASPSERIAKFKATREKREQLALGVVLIFLLFLQIGAIGTAGWLYRHPDQLYTPTGLLVYINLWNLQFMCVYAFQTIPLDLEALASEFRWKNIAAGRVPGLVSIGAWAFFPVSDVFSVIAIRAKYGWPSVSIVALVEMYLLRWKWEFASAPMHPSANHPLMRRPTVVEWTVMKAGAWGAGCYPMFDLYCIHDGQWDGRSVGRLGGFVLVLAQWMVCVVWWMKRARVR